MGKQATRNFYYQDEKPGRSASDINFRNIHIQPYCCAARALSASSRAGDTLLENFYGCASKISSVVDYTQGFVGVSVAGSVNISRIPVWDCSLNSLTA